MPQPRSLHCEAPAWQGVKDPQELRLILDAIRQGERLSPDQDIIHSFNIQLLLHRFPVMRLAETKRRAVESMRNLLEQIQDERILRATDQQINDVARHYLA
jgi:hypothetical protein